MSLWIASVVTGSTDGIGRAYAEQLARQGLHIVLISRSPEKLASVAQEIGNHHIDHVLRDCYKCSSFQSVLKVIFYNIVADTVSADGK